MTTFVVQRVLAVIPVLLGVTILVFSMLHLIPGDPVVAMIGDQAASRADIERVREQLGLNEPLPVQYLQFVTGAAVGDLGRSISSGRPVTDEIIAQLGSTMELAVASIVLALVLGLGLGTLAAYWHKAWVDRLAILLATLGVSIPSFWLGLMLILVFTSWLGWIPLTGQGGIQHLVLPTATLGFILAAPIARMTRSALLDVLAQDYVRTARSKGLSEVIVVTRHAVPNSLIPVVNIVGLQFGALMASSVIVETVFSRQGIGRLVVEAIHNRDFPVVHGIVLLMGTAFVLINLVVDILHFALDPRLRDAG